MPLVTRSGSIWPGFNFASSGGKLIAKTNSQICPFGIKFEPFLDIPVKSDEHTPTATALNDFNQHGIIALFQRNFEVFLKITCTSIDVIFLSCFTT